jgi:hypothetical protein
MAGGFEIARAIEDTDDGSRLWGGRSLSSELVVRCISPVDVRDYLFFTRHGRDHSPRASKACDSVNFVASWMLFESAQRGKGVS